jgi:hypothetical protein
MELPGGAGGGVPGSVGGVGKTAGGTRRPGAANHFLAQREDNEASGRGSRGGRPGRH